MAATREPNGGEQRPNLWEELNRPRSERQPTPPPPAPGSSPSAGAAPSPVQDGYVAIPPPPSSGDPHVAVSTPDLTTAPHLGTVGDAPTDHDDKTVSDDTASSSAAVAMKRIDSQHLLLVGAAMFVVVTFFALRGLGGSPAVTTDDSAPLDDQAVVAITAPDVLSAIEEPTTTTSPPPAPEPEPTAMGLPAALLDGPQSQVFRLYRTALGRDPDRNGFAYWSDQVRLGVRIEKLANEFIASEEFGVQFDDGAAREERLEQLLTNAFGPPADDFQLEEWLVRFRGLEGAELLLAISEADETLAATGTLP